MTSAEIGSTTVARAAGLRRALVEAVAALPDAALGATIALDGDEAPLEQALARLGAFQEPRRRIRAVLAALGWDPPAAVRHLQWAPIARARLEASLTGVPDALLDMHPFAGEWSVRQQLGHVELTDIRYTIATQYAVRRTDGEPLAAPPEAYPPRDDNPSGNPGEPLATIRERLRAVRAEAIAPLLTIGDGDLLRPTEWHTAEHTVGFRLHRFAQHDLELTTDIQRTLVAAGFRPTHAVEYAATLVEGWGELESVLLGVPEPVYELEPPGGGPSPRAYLQDLAAADEQLLQQLDAVRS